MELGQLRVFLTVMDTGSVTRAAEMVGLSPGAVSQQLRALGAGLGVELFIRAGRKIAPTAHALRLAEHARAILHQVGRTEQEFSKDEAGDKRSFHFATGATALIYRLGKPLRLLRSVEGIDLVELADADQCCGFGGTFALKNAETSAAMLADKMTSVLSTGASVCTAGDSSCLMHIGGGLSRLKVDTRTVHLAQILASTDGTVETAR